MATDRRDKTYTVTFELEADESFAIEEIRRLIHRAMDTLPTTPFIDYYDMEVEVEES